MSRKDMYCQAQCAICRQYFYEDTMRRNDAGRLLCNSCFTRQLLAKREYFKTSSIPEITFIGGVSLLEILAVVVILALVAAFLFNVIMPIRQKTKGSELEFIFFKNQDTEIGRLASEAISIIEREQLLENIIKIAKDKPQELGQLENELARLGKSDEAIKELVVKLSQQGQSGETTGKLDETQLGEPEELELINNQRLQHRKSFEKTLNLAMAGPEDFRKLEGELRECVKWDGQPQKMGAAIKAIQEWQKTMEGRQR